MKFLIFLLLVAYGKSPVFSCELAGFSFNQPIVAGPMFSAFRMRDKKNQDGWGAALLTQRSMQLYKEPHRASRSPLADFLQGYQHFSATTFIGHVRNGSVGSRAYCNTHPFSRSLYDMTYILAHNGNLFHFRERLPLTQFQPMGDTDSEHLFAFLMDRIAGRGIRQQWTEEDFRWLQKVLLAVNDSGPMNVLLANNQDYLFVYRDKNDYTALHYVFHKAEKRTIIWRGSGQKMQLNTAYPTGSSGFLIATRPLTDEKWKIIPPGQLLVFKKGKIVFSGPAVDDWYH